MFFSLADGPTVHSYLLVQKHWNKQTVHIDENSIFSNLFYTVFFKFPLCFSSTACVLWAFKLSHRSCYGSMPRRCMSDTKPLDDSSLGESEKLSAGRWKKKMVLEHKMPSVEDDKPSYSVPSKRRQAHSPKIVRRRLVFDSAPSQQGKPKDAKGCCVKFLRYHLCLPPPIFEPQRSCSKASGWVGGGSKAGAAQGK